MRNLLLSDAVIPGLRNLKVPFLNEGFIPKRDLGESPRTCHSEGAERPKNLINTRKYEILRFAQDDTMALRKALNFE